MRLKTPRMRGTDQGTRWGKAGRLSRAESHSSPGGASTLLCQSARQLASRWRRAAAGPPRSATSHLAVPTCAGPSASAAAHAGSGTSPGAGGPPARIHL
eukprot:7436537-Lingulodinium_polyedra.AAC.1